VSSNRVFYRAAPPPTGQPGAPRKDGARFKCSDPQSHGAPDQQWQGTVDQLTDAKGRPVAVACWHHLHSKACRAVSFSVLRVTRHSARDTKRDPRLSWFLWPVPPPPPPPFPCRRFQTCMPYATASSMAIAATKAACSGISPACAPPEQFQNWTDVVAATRNQLVLARHLNLLVPQPWERAGTAAARRGATPQQVRRALGPIIGKLGTPAGTCQPRGKSPGRPTGTRIKPATRFPVIKKTVSKKKSGRI